MIRLLILLALPLSVFADDRSYTIGEELFYQLAVCAFKDKAVAVADADAKDGFEAARDLFNSIDECAMLPVRNAQVGRVVHHVQVKRGDKEERLNVVEITREGKVLAYFLTALPVVAKLSVEPKRGSNS